MKTEQAIRKPRTPLVGAPTSMIQVTEDVSRWMDHRPGPAWFVGFVVAVAALILGIVAVAYQIKVGIGTWGLNKTIGWAFDITNFVFWVGIGHAGTLISAILLLFRQKWRTSVNRSAEAMTIFAVMCAAIFPLIHMGRPWLAFWVFPYPNTRGSLWVNFRSPLLWDVFAISTYFTISLVFWYVGMIPDIATLRDRLSKRGEIPLSSPPPPSEKSISEALTPSDRPGKARSGRYSLAFKRFFYTLLAVGWDGSNRTWSRYEALCLILAGLAAPLVVSVHSIVSMDFATSVIPGWHATIFPPYFVVGAVFSGFAMVTTLLIITRRVMKLENYITTGHLEAMAKIILLTGSIVGFAYGTELFTSWYSANPYEQFAFSNRIFGPYGWAYAIMVFCNVIVPQLLWSKKIRTTPALLFPLTILVNVGMWFERFVIIMTSLHRDYLPSSWAMYTPTFVEVATFIGTFGLFFTCFLLFVRLLPVIAMWEVKAVVAHEHASHDKEVTS